jgi:hypothetical protein
MISRIHKTMAKTILLPGMTWKSVCFFILALALIAVPSRAQSLTITPASDMASDPQSEALARARSAVEKLFERSGNMTCVEKVTQSILDNYARPSYEEHSLFNYRFQADSSGKSFKFAESREKLQAPFRDTGRTLLLTDGFGNMLLILHPAYAPSYNFVFDGNEVIGGVNTMRFRFTSVPGASSPLMLRVGEQNYSVALDGAVWIEPQSGNVVQLTASGGSGMAELGIRSIRSEIQYRATEFHNPEETYWMPESATIDVETSRRHWRNIHKFSAYKRFQATNAEKDPAGNH